MCEAKYIFICLLAIYILSFSQLLYTCPVLFSLVLSKKVTESDFHVKETVLVWKERKQFQDQSIAAKSQKSQKTIEIQNWKVSSDRRGSREEKGEGIFQIWNISGHGSRL